MVTRYFYLLRFFLAVTDFILINTCLFLGYYLANKYFVTIDQIFYREIAVISNMIWLVCAATTGLYSSEKVSHVNYIYQTTGLCLLLHSVLFIFYLLVLGRFYFPGEFLLAFYSLSFFGFLLSRFTGTGLQNLLVNNPNLKTAVGIMDMNNDGLKLAHYLNSQNSLDFRGFLHKEQKLIKAPSSSYSLAQSFKTAAKAGIYELYVCMDFRNTIDMQSLIMEGEKHCIRVKFVPNMLAADYSLKFDRTGDFMSYSARHEPLEDIGNRFRKRLFDIVISSLVILFILSWLYPILALIIKMQSPGPVIFKQLRSGRDNTDFWCYKFRSMRINSQSGQQQASRNDSRITPVGRFLRKTSLDEFPQFFNVLNGSMSIIGPRPHMVSHTEHYSELIDTYMTRHFLKPGISGWAQVNGYRGETKDIELMEARVEHDIWYMGNWNLTLDFKILFMTVGNIFKGDTNAF